VTVSLRAWTPRTHDVVGTTTIVQVTNSNSWF